MRQSFFVRLILVPTLALFALSTALCPQRVDAFDEFMYDVQLIRRLADVGMKNYALLHIDRMLSKYPDRKDHIYYAKARFHYTINERRQGEEAISRIPASSPFFIESQLIVAEEALQKGQLDSAEKAYAEYFRQVQKPASQDPGAVAAFQRAVSYYAQVQIEKGNGERAAEILGYLQKIEGDQAPSPDQLTLSIAQAAYSATEVRIGRNEPVDKKLVEKQIENLLAMQWRRTGLDPVFIDAYIQAARGHIYLGQHQEALALLKTIGENAAVVAENLPPEQSPLPTAFFYYARIFDETGRQKLAKGDKEGARQDFMIAATFYNERLLKAFPDSPLADKALAFYGKLSDVVKEQFNVQLASPVGGMGNRDFPVAVENGDRFYDAGDHEKAVNSYFKAFRMGRLNRRLPQIGTRLIDSLGNLDRLLEASVVASYLGDVFPEAESTHIAMLQVGQLYLKQAKPLPEGEEKEEMTNKAMQIWSQFVHVAPDHPKAPDIAYFLAEMQYGKAETIARASNEIQDVQEKERMKEMAREQFAKAVPRYITVIEKFPATSQGVRALYKLGWVYYNTGQNKEAADYFLQYVRRETDPANNRDRLLAKFYAAERLMFSDSPKDAVEHFNELLSWYEEDSGGPDTDIEGAARIKENASNFIGWSYDLHAEQFRPALNRIKQQIDGLEDQIAASEEIIQQAEQAITIAEDAGKAADKELHEKKTAINAPLPDPEQRALNEAMPSEQEMTALTKDEQQQMIAHAKEQSIEIAERFRQQDINVFQGEIAVIEGEKMERASQVQTLQNRLQRQEATLEQQTDSVKDLAKEQTKLEQYLKDLVDPVQERRQQIQTMQDELDKIKEQFSKAAQAARNHSDPETRKKAAAVARKLQEDGRELTAKVADAKKALDRRMPPDFKQQVESLQRRLDKAKEDKRDLVEKTRNLTQQAAITRQELAIAEKTLDAHDAVTALNQAKIELLRRNQKERETAAVELELDARRSAANQAWQGVHEAKIAKTRLIEEQTGKTVDMAQADIAAAKNEIAALQEEREPINNRLLKQKKTALDSFLEFLKNHPESKYVPSQMARVGAIYLEMKDYEKAVKYLNELAERFPQEDVTANALFDLGRAQFEVGDMDRAVETFNRILDKPADLSTSNLRFLADAMMEAGEPEFSVRVQEELMARATNPRHEDYARLQGLEGKLYERLIFRTANAALAAGMYDKVVRYSNQLLKINERTAYFFQLKMSLAKAMREKDQPDYQGAIESLTEILRFAQDETTKNKALVEMGRTFMMNEALGAQSCRRALAQYGQLSLFTGDDVILLVDPDDPENAPFIEEALYQSAVCYALLSEKQAREAMVNKYKEVFPTGRYASDIDALPPAKF